MGTFQHLFYILGVVYLILKLFIYFNNWWRSKP